MVYRISLSLLLSTDRTAIIPGQMYINASSFDEALEKTKPFIDQNRNQRIVHVEELANSLIIP